MDRLAFACSFNADWVLVEDVIDALAKGAIDLTFPIPQTPAGMLKMDMTNEAFRDRTARVQALVRRDQLQNLTGGASVELVFFCSSYSSGLLGGMRVTANHRQWKVDAERTVVGPEAACLLALQSSCEKP